MLGHQAVLNKSLLHYSHIKTLTFSKLDAKTEYMPFFSTLNLLTISTQETHKRLNNSLLKTKIF